MGQQMEPHNVPARSREPAADCCEGTAPSRRGVGHLLRQPERTASRGPSTAASAHRRSRWPRACISPGLGVYPRAATRRQRLWNTLSRPSRRLRWAGFSWRGYIGQGHVGWLAGISVGWPPRSALRPDRHRACTRRRAWPPGLVPVRVWASVHQTSGMEVLTHEMVFARG